MFFRKNKISIFIIFVIIIFTLTPQKITNLNKNKSILKNIGVKYEYSSGVLLGLRKDEKNGFSSYRTLWISPVNGTLKLTKEGSGILMPYENEFLKIEQNVFKFDDKKSFIEYLDVHPADKKSIKKEIKKDNGEIIKENIKLNFVGNKYVSINCYYNYEQSADKKVKIDKVMVADVNKMINNFDKIEGISLKNVFKKDIIQQFVNKTTGEPDITYNDNSENKNWYENDWGIFRENGKWIAKFAKMYTKKGNNNYYHAGYELVNIPFELPQIIKAYDDLIFSFESIKKKYPDAIDVISSPKEDIIIVCTTKKIYVYPCTNKITGKPSMIEKPVLIIDKSSNESLVMAQWATNKYVDKWNDEVNKYLN